MADASQTTFAVKLDDELSLHIRGLQRSNEQRVRWTKIGVCVSAVHGLTLLIWCVFEAFR